MTEIKFKSTTSKTSDLNALGEYDPNHIWVICYGKDLEELKELRKIHINSSAFLNTEEIIIGTDRKSPRRGLVKATHSFRSSVKREKAA